MNVNYEKLIPELWSFAIKAILDLAYVVYS